MSAGCFEVFGNCLSYIYNRDNTRDVSRKMLDSKNQGNKLPKASSPLSEEFRAVQSLLKITHTFEANLQRWVNEASKFEKPNRIKAQNKILEAKKKNQTKLDLWGLGLTVLPPIKELPQLKVLNLSNNEIKDIPNTYFDTLTELEFLSLGYNRLTNIPAKGCFKKLTRLQDLYLSGNQLTTLTKNSLAGLTGVHSLRLEGNTLKPQKGLFDDFTVFQSQTPSEIEETANSQPETNTFEANLQRWVNNPDKFETENRIKAQTRILAAKKNNATTLDLQGLGLKVLPPIKELTQLKELNLSNNELTLLPVGCFETLTGLKKLDLSRNLTILTNGCLKGLAGLDYLKL
jgi:Leucine-rich repeat (LRR) protein